MAIPRIIWEDKKKGERYIISSMIRTIKVYLSAYLLGSVSIEGVVAISSYRKYLFFCQQN